MPAEKRAHAALWGTVTRESSNETVTPSSPVQMPFDDEELRNALADANLPTLIPVLYQLTGDDRWCKEPYRPTRTRGLDDHATGGFSENLQNDIRAAAFDSILDWSRGRAPAVPAPDEETLRGLLTLTMGEPVPHEYARMMRAEMGFDPVSTPTVAEDQSHDFSVVIIGAGVSGLAAAVSFRAANIRFVVLERDHEVGGVWLENRYPGAGVDTPSYLYSLSFHTRNWTSQFAKRAEVADYLKGVADHYDLRDDIRLGVSVSSAVYDEDGQRWTVIYTDADGTEHRIEANAVISAVGLFNQPAMPKLPGLDIFDGPVFHTARWPDGLDVTGKNVAIIGTGASAMQIVPAIADHVKHLTVFQRSPQWVAPSAAYFQSIPAGVHWLIENVPYYHAWYRFRLAWTFNDKTYASLQIDPEWPHPERALNAINDSHRQYFTSYLTERLGDRTDLVEKSLPTYPPFGKRILLDNGWYDALRKPGVELVTESVEELTAHGVRTSEGEHLADVVVLSTGFSARRYLGTVDVVGRDGLTLRDVWGDDDATAYLGITNPGFPNLFLLYGPNTNPGAGGSVIFTVECQVRYVVGLITRLLDAGGATVECRPEAHDRYVEQVDEVHSRMIWSHPGMTTYSRNAAGRVVTNSPWRVVDYWAMTQEPDLADYVVEEPTERSRAAQPTSVLDMVDP